ncbi:MAG: hypothetical protein PHN69_05930 [Candidatus Pacebacteria bacterium]|nr:hypothetical protein [Candidatus Paceibacterota bacterium]
MLKLFKNKRGSEVIQNLIVIAIMGALAIVTFGYIGNTMKDKNETIVDNIGTDLENNTPTEE